MANEMMTRRRAEKEKHAAAEHHRGELRTAPDPRNDSRVVVRQLRKHWGDCETTTLIVAKGKLIEELRMENRRGWHAVVCCERRFETKDRRFEDGPAAFQREKQVQTCGVE